MKAPPILSNEKERLHALSKYKLNDLIDDKIFNQITELASVICETPICLITIIDENKQWFLSNHGLENTVQTPRDLSFCAHAIADDKLLEITDTTLDERFSDNPFVVCTPKIRFYAGMPLVDAEGYKLGTICLIDKKERFLSEKQTMVLKLFSKMIISIFEEKINGRDCTATKEVTQDETTNAIENFKGAIVESIPQGVVSVTRNGRIFFTNEKANNIFGYDDRELLNINFCILLKDGQINLEKQNMTVTEVIRKDKTRHPVELSISPLKDSKHFVIGIKEISLG